MNDGWIELGLPYGPIYGDGLDSDGRINQLDSLAKRGLDVPGVLIKIKTGPHKNRNGICCEDGSEIYLIGHINELRGVCDDCTDLDSDTIVLAYKIVWSPS